MPEAYLIIDAQWGSTGKGLLAGKLAVDREPDVVVCNFGPNAGHTFVLQDRKMMVQQIPTGFVSPALRHLLIGPGAIINPAILARELEQFPEARVHLQIHEHAAVVEPQDIEEEKGSLVHIGSTRKGTAAAAARKAARPVGDPAGPARVAREHADLLPYVVSVQQYDAIIRDARVIQVESAQGVELSLDRGYFYPYCTGRNVTPERALDDVAVPMRYLRETCATLRTYPIRVGDEFDATGNKIGTSGPVYPDMTELTWEEISSRMGQHVLERTTVTNKVRRIFSFSHDQFNHALWVLGSSSLFVNFCNYLDPGARADSVHYNEALRTFLEEVSITAAPHESNVRWLGFGPTYADVREV
jgi:adenylosuccinate synthase